MFWSVFRADEWQQTEELGIWCPWAPGQNSISAIVCVAPSVDVPQTSLFSPVYCQTHTEVLALCNGVVSLVIAQVICMEKKHETCSHCFYPQQKYQQNLPPPWCSWVGFLHLLWQTVCLCYKAQLICRLQSVENVKVFSKGKITNKM